MSVRLALCTLGLILIGSVESQAKIIITYGDDVAHLGDLPPELAQAIQREHNLNDTPAVGYKYSHFGIFWLPIWTWDGEYCVYAEVAPREYVVVSLQPKDVAELLNIPEDQVAPPFSYRYPTGLLIILGLVVLGVGHHLYQRRKVTRLVQQVESLLSDPQYQQAVELFGRRAEELAQEKLQAEANRQGTSLEGLPEHERERLETEAVLQAKQEAIQYLVQRGVPPAEAAENMERILGVLAAASDEEES